MHAATASNHRIAAHLRARGAAGLRSATPSPPRPDTLNKTARRPATAPAGDTRSSRLARPAPSLEARCILTANELHGSRGMLMDFHKTSPVLVAGCFDLVTLRETGAELPVPVNQS